MKYYVNLHRRPQVTRLRRAILSRLCGRPSVSSDLALAGRPHRTPKRCRSSAARGAVSSGLAGSPSGNCRAAQARASNSEQRPRNRSFACRPGEPITRAAVYLLARRPRNAKSLGRPRLLETRSVTLPDLRAAMATEV